jgi:F0F1-type ATP synthase membrane subunit c/vacuolar-type H+-ATPase subunit K
MIKNSEHARRRRAVLKAGIAVLSAVPVAALAQQKLAQSAVQYQTSPKDGQMCSNCVNFIAPNACKLVDGNISPNGWCIAYGPKA